MCIFLTGGEEMRDDIREAMERLRLAEVKWVAAYHDSPTKESPSQLQNNQWVQDLRLVANAYIDECNANQTGGSRLRDLKCRLLGHKWTNWRTVEFRDDWAGAGLMLHQSRVCTACGKRQDSQEFP